jgi:excisionase family DNA binding protein
MALARNRSANDDADMTEAADTRRATPDATTRQDAPPSVVDDIAPDATPGVPVVLQIEAAKRAGVSVRTLQRAIQRGELPARRQGRKCWVRLDHLEQWRVTHTTHGTSLHTTTHDTDAPPVTRRGMPNDAPRRATLEATRDAGALERLRKEVIDARAERDRWHEAFLRESEHRTEETRQLRQLLQQEQALSFSRLHAVEATTRHDTPPSDASPEKPQDIVVAPSPDTTSFTPATTRPWWKRALGIN